MVNFPPEHCPYCGAKLEPIDSPTVYSCPSCDRPVFHNPTPSARVLVLDGDRFLLVKQWGGGVRGKWLTPGGKIEIGNEPAEHAAIELEEETGLVVDPADLSLVDATTAEAPDDHHIVSIRYTVPAELTSGTVEAGDDAAQARFWTLPEFERADQNGFPEQVDRVAELRRAASRVLDDGRS